MAASALVIPTTLRDPVLVMTHDEARLGPYPTIFLGIVHKEYKDEHWTSDKNKIINIFQMSDCNTVDLKVQRRGIIIDGEKLGKDMTQAINDVNKLNTSVIRIVHLGTGTCPAVDEAVESLVKGWNVPADQKEIDFIAIGESDDYHHLNTCKSLVLRQMCKTLRYYNTIDYNYFGYLEESKKSPMHMRVTPQQMQQLAENFKQFFSDAIGK